MYRMWHAHWHRPSRLLWFAIGAVSATWFMKSKFSAEQYRVKHCSRHQIPQEAYPAPASSQAQTADAWQWQKTLKEKYPFGWPPQETQAEANAPQNAAVPNAQRSPDAPAASDGWEEERQRLLKIKQQATNSVSLTWAYLAHPRTC